MTVFSLQRCEGHLAGAGGGVGGGAGEAVVAPGAGLLLVAGHLPAAAQAGPRLSAAAAAVVGSEVVVAGVAPDIGKNIRKPLSKLQHCQQKILSESKYLNEMKNICVTSRWRTPGC